MIQIKDEERLVRASGLSICQACYNEQVFIKWISIKKKNT